MFISNISEKIMGNCYICGVEIKYNEWTIMYDKNTLCMKCYFKEESEWLGIKMPDVIEFKDM